MIVALVLFALTVPVELLVSVWLLLLSLPMVPSVSCCCNLRREDVIWIAGTNVVSSCSESPLVIGLGRLIDFNHRRVLSDGEAAVEPSDATVEDTVKT